MSEEARNPASGDHEAQEHAKKVLPPDVKQIDLNEYNKIRAKKIEHYQHEKEHKQSSSAKIMRLIGNTFWILMAILAITMIGFLIYGFFNLPKETKER